MTTATPSVPPTTSGAATGADELVGTYRNYADAQRAVDTLSDREFPVGAVRVVGRDVTIVEDVTGRLTTGRAAGLGALSGAWAGLFVGLLLGLFALVGWFAVVLTGLVVGAVFGTVAGAVGHAATRGRRDFTSVRSLQAASYEVYVTAGLGERARGVLAG